AVGGGISSESPHTPRGLFRQRVRHEPDLLVTPLHAQPHASAGRRAHGEADPLTRRKVDAVGGREARGVDPRYGSSRRLKALRDPRDERRLALLDAGAGTGHDMERDDGVIRQRRPGKPAAVREYSDRDTVDGERDVTPATADA